MILSYVSVLILIISSALSAALLSLQEILNCCVNYILINECILNSTQASLKFPFITMSISNITELSNFSLMPLFSFTFGGFWLL